MMHHAVPLVVRTDTLPGLDSPLLVQHWSSRPGPERAMFRLTAGLISILALGSVLARDGVPTSPGALASFVAIAASVFALAAVCATYFTALVLDIAVRAAARSAARRCGRGALAAAAREVLVSAAAVSTARERPGSAEFSAIRVTLAEGSGGTPELTVAPPKGAPVRTVRLPPDLGLPCHVPRAFRRLAELTVDGRATADPARLSAHDRIRLAGRARALGCP